VADSPLGRWLRQLTPARRPSQEPGATPVAARERREPPRRADASIEPADAPRRLALRPGERLRGYTIIREVGRGAMATVYQARHDADGAIAALKVLTMAPDGLDGLDDARLRLLREAEAAGRIQHPDRCWPDSGRFTARPLAAPAHARPPTFSGTGCNARRGAAAACTTASRGRLDRAGWCAAAPGVASR